jgi:hypothetical protein
MQFAAFQWAFQQPYTFDAFMQAAEIYFYAERMFMAELLRFLPSNLLPCNSRHRACDV